MNTIRPRTRHALPALALVMVLAAALLWGVRHRSPAASAPAGATTPAARAAPSPAVRVVLKNPDLPEHVPWYGLKVISAEPGLYESEAHHPPPAINAAGGILIDVDSGRILWEQNPHRSLPPASTTKIMTALVTLQNFEPQHLVTVTAEALHQEGDETLMGLIAGERLTVEELLTGALLVSGNDAATTLAVDTVGMDNFVTAMNAQAGALGLRDSHFVSPVGLDDPEQRSSAFDLAVLARTAIDRFPIFQRLVSTPEAVLPANQTHHQYSLSNLNELLRTYPGAVGIKPGWTGNAGSCLVGMAVRGGHRLISVVLNAPFPVTQTRGLMDWGFAEEGP